MADLDDFKIGSVPEGVTPKAEDKSIIGEKPDTTVESVIDDAFGEKGYFSNMLKEVLSDIGKDAKPQASIKGDSKKEKSLDVPGLPKLGNSKGMPKLDFSKSLEGSMKKFSESLLGPVKNTLDKFSPKANFAKATNAVKEKLHVPGLPKLGKKTENEGDKPNSKVSAKPSDLKGLPKACTLGFLLIHKDLQDMKPKDKKKKDGGFNIGDVLGSVVGIVAAVAALVVFAVALKLFEGVNFGKAIAGVTFFVVFIGIMAVLSKLVEKNTQSFINFGKGSAILTVGLVLFTAALLFVDFTINRVDMNNILQGVGLFVAFVGLMTVFAMLLGNNIQYFISFAISTIVLTAGLVLFSLSLFVVQYCIQNISLLAVIGGLVLFLAFTAIAVGLGILLGNAAPALLIMAVGSILLSIGLAAFSLALLLYSIALTSIDIPKLMLLTLVAIPLIAEMAVLFGAAGLVGTAAILALPGLAILTAASLMLTTVFFALKIAMLTAKIVKAEDVANAKNLIGDNGMLGLLDPFLGIGGIKLLAKAIAAIATITAVASAVKTMSKIFVAFKTISDLSSQVVIDKAMLQPVVDIVSLLGDVASGLGVKGAAALAIMSEALVPITQAMNAIPDLITKFANLDISQDKIDEAVVKMNYLATEFIEKVFNEVADKIKGASKKTVEAIKVLPELTSSVQSMLEVVDAVSSKTLEEILQAVEKAKGLGQGVHDIADAIHGLKGNWKLDEINNTLPQLKQSVDLCVDVANASNNFDGFNLQAINFLQQMVPTFALFTDNIPINASNVKNAMKRFKEGLDNVDEDTLKKSVILDQSLTMLSKPRELGWIQKLKGLSQAINPINKTNKALAEMAKTFKKISNDADWLDKMAEVMSYQVGGEQSVNGAQMGARPATASSSSSYSEKIYRILSKWEEGGVNVNFDMPEREENLEPETGEAEKNY